jgi:hypothetical protein
MVCSLFLRQLLPANDSKDLVARVGPEQGNAESVRYGQQT